MTVPISLDFTLSLNQGATASGFFLSNLDTDSLLKPWSIHKWASAEYDFLAELDQNAWNFKNSGQFCEDEAPYIKFLFGYSQQYRNITEWFLVSLKLCLGLAPSGAGVLSGVLAFGASARSGGDSEHLSEPNVLNKSQASFQTIQFWTKTCLI